ncbi:MAG: SDR family oxidoreductase [Oscillatoria sp. PMC 1068.18]|nr:SDR family oxidoreductase [Oscillatoria sp. PMC 1076.18]MEC4989673.1 SDR family oxidoreductase [Oscillatoria sp. PMC 1068.18]
MSPTVLITGASQGIGKATAHLFAQNGYNVVLVARQRDRLEAVAQELTALGHNALAIPTDVSDLLQVKILVEKAITAYHAIDVLVNNAGICLSGAMEKTTIEDWQKIINVNLWGYIYTIHSLLPHFLERQSGTIINVGSFGGKVPLPEMTAYCTSKYAITGLTETLRLELEPKGIHVCGIHPSVTNTDFLERAIFSGDENSDAKEKRQQTQKILQSPLTSKPEAVAKEIWNLVKHPQAEVIVGSAVVPATLHRLAPGLTNWTMQQFLSKK